MVSLTGVDDPYEVPEDPDVVIEPGLSLAEAVDSVITALARAEAGTGTDAAGTVDGDAGT